MPLYDFSCSRCGSRFEELVRAGASARCPACGAEETVRLFSPVSAPHRFHLYRRFARDSDARRSEREAERFERFREARRRRREQGSGGSETR